MHHDSPTDTGNAPEVERVIAASVAAPGQATFSVMTQMREEAHYHIAPKGIHAALLTQSGWFVYWMEGPGPAVLALAGRAAGDPRNHDQVIVHHSRGPRVLSLPWSMMIGPSTEPQEVFGQRVAELHLARQAGIQFAPTSVVRRLVAPLRIRPPASMLEAETFHRVGVVSADDGRAFDFVRWVGERNECVHELRRFAGDHDLDSGGESVELITGAHPSRLIAFARAGLGHGLRRAMLADWPYLVLLVSNSLDRNIVLLEKVVEACQGLRTPPRLLGVTADEHAQASLGVAARMAGLDYRRLAVSPAEHHADTWQALAVLLAEETPRRTLPLAEAQASWAG